MDSVNSPDSEYAEASSEGLAIGAKDVLATLRQDWPFPVFGCLIGLMLAAAYLVFVPAPYKSTARILLDTSVNRYLQTNKIADEPTLDEVAIASQVYILSSESIIVPVVRSMNLAHDPEFVGPLRDTQNPGYIDKLKKIVKQSIGWNGADATVDPEAVLERTTVETFLKNLSVVRGDVANVIDVTFTSQDPNKAAKIANAVADTYIAADLETRLKSTKTISQWLQSRLLELRVQALDADRALQNYKVTNNLFGADKNLLSSQQLSDLNTQLTNARIAVAEAKARVDSMRQMADVGAGEPTISAAAVMGRQEINDARGVNSVNARPTNFVANNTDIVNLRSEYRSLAARVAELEPDLGSRHSAVVKLHKKMDELRRTIRDQEQLIADSYSNEYQMAKARESELAATVAQVIGETGTGSQAQVKMRELESSADALRTLYNSLLQKFEEINSIQTETVSSENARIINRATPPLHKISKKTAAVVAGSIMLGLFLGAGAAVGREWAADVFRTPKAVEQVTGIQCVILPMVEDNGGGSAKSTMIEEFVLDAPFSRFTETLRNVKVLINSAQVERGGRVIGVVSSVPNEGKTTIAANLAALVTMSAGARTLVIDSDVHRRLLSAKLAPDAGDGLVEALVDPSRLDTLVSKRERSGLDVLPCALSSRIPNAAELLGSPGMGELLDAARKTYDYIIVEIAPIMSVVDIKMIERFIDRFLLIVEWGQTKRSLVLEALSEAQMIRERLLGIVLNKADPVALRRLEAYKGDKFRAYYEE
jgi:succinoglycan biosynthesis transport protein ExoP